MGEFYLSICADEVWPSDFLHLDANYIQKFFEGKEFLSEIFASALG